MAAVTFTGDLVTDALRAAGSDGDGRAAPDSSVGIWPDRTTLAQNGGFEVDARFWSVSLGSAIRDATHVRFGQYAWKTTASGVGVRWINAYAPASSIVPGVYSFAASLWAEGSVIGQSAQIYINGKGGASGDGIVGGIVSSTTLVAGWNDLTVTAEVTQSDRAELDFTVSLPASQSGDIAWLDGTMPCASPTPLPYVEIGQVQDEYLPAVNLLSNGDFETDTATWTPVSMTKSQSTDQAKTGTHSLKLVATATGQVWAQGNYPGTPIPVANYGLGVWVFAPSAVVGKTAQLTFNATGGATGQAQVGAGSVTPLNAGWNYFFCAGTPAQSDRTALVPLVFLNGAAIGDVIYVDTVRLGSGYVAPPFVSVTRAKGRIQTPILGLSARQGWIALRIRPEWSSSSVSLAYRPPLPVTLWDWRDDANNRLTLTYDGGYLIMIRVAGGVADIAQTPLSVTRGAAATIVAAWTAGGVAVSVNGGALRYGYTRVMADDFERPDSNVLGSAPIGGETWNSSGASGVTLASGRFIPKTGIGNGYAMLDLGTAPARIGGLTSLDAGSGGSGAVNTTLISSGKDFAITDAVHCLLTQTGWTLQVVQSSVFTGLATRAYAIPLAADGTVYPVALAIDGNTATIEAADGNVYSVTDARIGALAGRYCIWEVGRSSPGGTALCSRWDSVYADNFASAGVSGHVPTLVASQSDLGSAAGASAYLYGEVLWHLTGRGTINATDIVALNAVAVDPTEGTLRTHPRLRHLWPALTNSMQQFSTAIPYLGNGGIA